MKLTELPHIGPKTEEILNKMEIMDVHGLLMYFPRDFEVFQSPRTIAETGYATFAAIKGTFTEAPFVRRVNGKTLTAATFADEVGGKIRVTWFNAPYIKNQIKPGTLCIIRGRVYRKYSVLSMNQPKVFQPESYEKLIGVLQPVYTVAKGISSAAVAKAVSAAMESSEFASLDLQDGLPLCIRERYGLPGLQESVRAMHFPANEEQWKRASARFTFEEIFTFSLIVKLKGSDKKARSNVVIENSPEADRFLHSLPFELTDSQREAIAEISADMASGYAMNRLLQGDVGSGKTIVAVAAMAAAAFAGYQSALMAPTEVLARQHAQTIEKLFKAAGMRIGIALLTGSMSGLERQAALEAIEDGRAGIIIGTHALFQKKVTYKKLGLVVTDEQHRFGTKQRKAMLEKGDGPHMLVMSATPIPRTLALIIYGDMDVSVLKQMPKGRLPIKNAVVDESYRPNAYRFIEREVRKGRQAYVICPMIEYSEGLEAENVTDYTQLLRDVLPEDISVGMLHGKMSADEKNAVMEKFAAGKIQVLVSTTVVEVGVDVPNATVMMIENADRFGLATLHQLRGRVGRGDEQSYCIIVSKNRSEEARSRLEILGRSNDGFEIASMDLGMRGPGEFLGNKQSGALAFRYFDPQRDMLLAQSALEAVQGVLDETLPLTDGEKERLKEKTSAAGSGIIL